MAFNPRIPTSSLTLARNYVNKYIFDVFQDAGVFFLKIGCRTSRYLRIIVWVCMLFLIFLFVLFVPLWVQPILFTMLGPGPVHTEAIDESLLVEEQSKMQKQIVVLNKKLAKMQPGTFYLVINSTANEFSLYKAGTLIKSGKCSTGSYVLLEGEGSQRWMFKTPKGELKIKGKTTSPVWKKPDWVFVEEGLPIPPVNHPSRYEYGILGDYALSLGNGYLIHGTLYKRFLGMPVTHGCIRLNDEDLELVYKSMSIDGKVFIY